MTIPALERWYDYVKTKDRAVLWDALHPDAVFESPVVHTPQHGREITFKYLSSAASYQWPNLKAAVANPAASATFRAWSSSAYRLGDGRPSVSRREVTEPGPRSCRPNSVASEASRISPTVFHPTAVTAFLILVENRTFSMGVSSGSSGAG